MEEEKKVTITETIAYATCRQRCILLSLIIPFIILFVVSETISTCIVSKDNQGMYFDIHIHNAFGYSDSYKYYDTELDKYGLDIGGKYICLYIMDNYVIYSIVRRFIKLCCGDATHVDSIFYLVLSFISIIPFSQYLFYLRNNGMNTKKEESKYVV